MNDHATGGPDRGASDCRLFLPTVGAGRSDA
jgi:hypothetical protein